MKDAVLVDTDVVIDFLRGHGQAIQFIRAHWNQLMIPALVVTELYAGVKGRREEEILEEFIGQLNIVPITAELAKIAGLFKRDFSKSHGVGLGDAIVAAAAISESASLATLNVKHYPMIKGLHPAYRK